MRDVDSLHDEAMSFADRARVAELEKDPALHDRLMERAFCLEREAALLLERSKTEPSRSILFRSAAAMGVKCRQFEEAENLARMGAEGEPSPFEREQLKRIAKEARKGKRVASPSRIVRPVFSEYHRCLRSWMMKLGAGAEASRTISLAAIRLSCEEWIRRNAAPTFAAVKSNAIRLLGAESRLPEEAVFWGSAGKISTARPKGEGSVAVGSPVRPDLKTLIRRELERLPSRKRRCFLMKTDGGASDEQIAAVLGITVEQVESVIEETRDRIEEAGS